MPLVIGGAAVVGGLGSAIGKWASNSDKTNYNATDFGSTSRYDPNQFNYGGAPNGADWYTNQAQGMGGRYANAGWQAQRDFGRRGAQENYQLADREAQTRAQQMGGVDLARMAAMGEAPSEAAFQMQAGLNNAAAQQNAQAASARGGAALANAQSNAGANIAAMQNQTFNQAAAIRAREMAEARGLYGSLGQGMRASDLNRLQMGNQMAQFNQGGNDAYTLGMGQLGLGYYNAGLGVQGQQLQAGMAQQNMLAGGQQAADQRNFQANMYNTEAGGRRWDQLGQVAVGAAQAGAGMYGSGK